MSLRGRPSKRADLTPQHDSHPSPPDRLGHIGNPISTVPWHEDHTSQNRQKIRRRQVLICSEEYRAPPNSQLRNYISLTPRSQAKERRLQASLTGAHGMDADEKRKQLAAALNRVAHGDRPALRLVYDMTSAKLFGACLRILNDRGEAEDVLQEVYLTVWNKAAAFDEARASPITWLVAIARNRAIDRARSRAPSRRSEPIEAAADVADPGASAFESLASVQEHERLK